MTWHLSVVELKVVPVGQTRLPWHRFVLPKNDVPVGQTGGVDVVLVQLWFTESNINPEEQVGAASHKRVALLKVVPTTHEGLA